MHRTCFEPEHRGITRKYINTLVNETTFKSNTQIFSSELANIWKRWPSEVLILSLFYQRNFVNHNIPQTMDAHFVARGLRHHLFTFIPKKRLPLSCLCSRLSTRTHRLFRQGTPSSSVYPSGRKAFPTCSQKLLPYSFQVTLFHVFMSCDECNYQLFRLVLYNSCYCLCINVSNFLSGYSSERMVCVKDLFVV